MLALFDALGFAGMSNGDEKTCRERDIFDLSYFNALNDDGFSYMSDDMVDRKNVHDLMNYCHCRAPLSSVYIEKSHIKN